jgi:hypothetical protein
MNVGDYLLVETKTQTGTFGTVLYRVDETGIECPNKGCDKKDGMWFSIVTGTGPAAIEGRRVPDCAQVVQQNIASGISRIIPKEEVEDVIRVLV